MKDKKLKLVLLSTFFICLFFHSGICTAKSSPRKVYMSYILHGNMNYDRYIRPTIWRDFPVIYNNLLDFMDDHPDFKGQLQFSGQTFKSLQQAAPQVIAHAMQIHKRGQLNFTGTFYSEPVNVNMDGETNYRCAKLGTSIIADAIGSTDGFYLQERAYHSQLPWILNHSGVSWVPVIIGDNTCFPFKLKGMDGSVSTCVPITSRNNLFDKIKEAPANSLFLIEEDYEIPQSFSATYQNVSSFDMENKDIVVEWITVKEYIGKFGVKEERYVDHSAKATNIQNGTYSRWTADPLDIIVQDYTNHAMSDFRVATIINSLSRFLFQQNTDEPFSGSKVTLKEDPLTWNIERADLYPDIEPGFLQHDGQVTILSKAEHLLLWAVNSDAKGWFPLYEKRRERINSFENSSALSEEIINRSLDVISQKIKVEGYDRYFIAFNAEPERKKTITLETYRPYDVYDYGQGVKLENIIASTGGKCNIEFESTFPTYGYKVFGLRNSKEIKEYNWTEGTAIENGDLKLTALDDRVIFEKNGGKIELSIDSFKIKALAEMSEGNGDDVWRNASPYGKARISTRNTLYPQLRVEKQIDWLVHMQQIFTLLPDRVLCEINFKFPHPTLLRKDGETKGNTFGPRGLTLQFKSGKPGKVFYDIPFGFSPHAMTGLSYFCPLSTGIFQFDEGGGFMITAGTGEQAFYTKPDEGEVGLFMGASTTSGPIRNVGMTFVDKTTVNHEPAWYAEPFHGTYSHKFMLFPFNGQWQGSHAPAVSKSFTQGVYIREFYPSQNTGTLPAEKSLITVDNQGIEITSMDFSGNSLMLRINDREGKSCDLNLTIKDKTKKIKVPSNGIINVTF
ncbi:MAG: hypothetical protein LLG13_00830 [Bacteroidales bacterium]|nr:hypothetical protein [Bacteroidales bacterium]